MHSTRVVRPHATAFETPLQCCCCTYRKYCGLRLCCPRVCVRVPVRARPIKRLPDRLASGDICGRHCFIVNGRPVSRVTDVRRGSSPLRRPSVLAKTVFDHGPGGRTKAAKVSFPPSHRKLFAKERSSVTFVHAHLICLCFQRSIVQLFGNFYHHPWDSVF